MQGITGGVRAAKEGHQVIMTPTSHCYFDYRQSLRCPTSLSDPYNNIINKLLEISIKIIFIILKLLIRYLILILL
jgi:hypothetical protein